MKEKPIPYPNPIFVADIGGTNANFGILTADNGRYKLLEYYKLPSQEIADFNQTVLTLLEKIAAEKHIRFSVMVIGVAGTMYGKQYTVQATHLPFKIDKITLHKLTGIEEILFINDFIAVACGYEWVDATVALNNVAVNLHAQKAFIGAGTGLGQSFAIFSPAADAYVPGASEGGHGVCAAYNSFDEELFTFIQEKKLSYLPVTFEHILSGKGISLLYEFLGTTADYPETDISHEIAHGRFQPDDISGYSQYDERCKQTFKMYVEYYARYAQQVALHTVSYGGLYIAGGIAAKNKMLFSNKHFFDTFTEHAVHRKLLEKIPLFLIQDYQVSLYGGAHYYHLYTRGIV